LGMLVQGVARAVPGRADETAPLLPAFREYRLLALSALAYYLSIWADKIVVYLVMGGDAAAFYAAIAAIAWFSVIPAFAWIYVQIETSFYQRFRAFYTDIEVGASLKQLKERADRISVEAKRILRGAGIVQASASGIAIAAAPVLVKAVGLSPDATPLFRMAAIGAAAQMLTLLEVLLLYYFDLRRDALVISTGLLAGEAAFTLAAWAAGWFPVVGYVVACALTASAGAVLVRRRLSTLVLDTFQSQPFGVS
jgi:polysaccharide biosynthesis protein PelG